MQYVMLKLSFAFVFHISYLVFLKHFSISVNNRFAAPFSYQLAYELLANCNYWRLSSTFSLAFSCSRLSNFSLETTAGAFFRSSFSLWTLSTTFFIKPIVFSNSGTVFPLLPAYREGRKKSKRKSTVHLNILRYSKSYFTAYFPTAIYIY